MHNIKQQNQKILERIKFSIRHCEMVTRNRLQRIYAQAHMDNTRREYTHQDALESVIQLFIHYLAV